MIKAEGHIAVVNKDGNMELSIHLSDKQVQAVLKPSEIWPR
jgi:hypothetical protein